uniref:Uncharacterized protein n=1 Tax=Arundo donax TaxID=35708 RepID=A0A0A9BUJ1_ARUDO
MLPPLRLCVDRAGACTGGTLAGPLLPDGAS